MTEIYDEYVYSTYYSQEHRGIVLQTNCAGFENFKGFLIKDNALFKFIWVRRNKKTTMALKYLSEYNIYSHADDENDIIVTNTTIDDDDDYCKRELSEYWDKYYPKTPPPNLRYINGEWIIPQN